MGKWPKPKDEQKAGRTNSTFECRARPGSPQRQPTPGFRLLPSSFPDRGSVGIGVIFTDKKRLFSMQNIMQVEVR